MKKVKKVTFTGCLYQDISTNRKPINIMEDVKGFPVASLEKRLVNEGIVPTIITPKFSNVRKADFVGEAGGGYGFSIWKEAVRANIKKVKVTVIVEEIDEKSGD